MSDAQRPAPPAAQNAGSPPGARSRSWADIFALPPPLRQLFQQFPLHTYPANALPARSLVHESQHALYIFTTDEAASRGGPSFNPSCLKWQTYLKICGIDFTTVSSNNHASPSGSLPFLLPHSASSKSKDRQSAGPIPASKIRRWAEDNVSSKQVHRRNMQEELHYALLDHSLRRAWLHLLYLDSSNAHVVKRLYVQPHSSNTFVNAVTTSQLRRAAEEEIRKSQSIAAVSPMELQQEGQDALVALSEELGGQTWFFGAEKPGLFDAAVFAYTHLLLDHEGMHWAAPPYRTAFEHTASNLVAHRNRLRDLCYA